MRTPVASLVLLTAVLAAPAFASMGGSPPPEPASSAQAETREESQATPRQQAEQLYGGAYDDVAKANLDLANHKDKNAAKKFKHALDRASGAVALDSTYFEAWNLVGFSSRKLGDYPRSLSAYDRCLRLKPDYAPAREYLGEAFVELDRIGEAREQLAWLQRLDAADQTKALSDRIAAWQAAHPGSGTVAPAPTSAADSTRLAPVAPADSSARAPAPGSGR